MVIVPEYSSTFSGLWSSCDTTLSTRTPARHNHASTTVGLPHSAMTSRTGEISISGSSHVNVIVARLTGMPICDSSVERRTVFHVGNRKNFMVSIIPR